MKRVNEVIIAILNTNNIVCHRFDRHQCREPFSTKASILNGNAA
jgi:hypothetical protein